MPSLRSILLLALYPAVIWCQFSERDPRYRLQTSDVIEVHYRHTPEFDQTVTIQPDGFVALTIVGDVRLQNLTLEQARAALVEKASKRLNDPEITIVLKEFEKPFFVVAGQVTHPGKFEMRGIVTPIEAIAMAGGFNNSSAKHSQVILLRRTTTDLARTQILDMKKAMNINATEQPGALQPGDVLVVPQNKISKVERFVKWANVGVFLNPF